MLYLLHPHQEDIPSLVIVRHMTMGTIGTKVFCELTVSGKDIQRIDQGLQHLHSLHGDPTQWPTIMERMAMVTRTLETLSSMIWHVQRHDMTVAMLSLFTNQHVGL